MNIAPFFYPVSQKTGIISDDFQIAVITGVCFKGDEIIVFVYNTCLHYCPSLK